MRIEQMHYLIEISKNKSLTSASQKLFVTPQALSLSIKNLEEELGILILERTALGVRLTKEGQTLLGLVSTFLQGLDNIKAKMMSIHQDALQGKMLLPAPHGVSESYLPRLLDHIYHNHPQLEVESREYEYLDLIQAVLQEEVYFALTYKVFINDVDIIQDIPEELNFNPFFQCRCVCLAQENFSISHYKTISLKSILKYPYIMYEPADYIFSKILSFAGRPDQVILASNTLVMQQLINSGVGIGISLVNEREKKPMMPMAEHSQMIEIKEKVRLVFGSITKKSQPLPKPIKFQLDYLEDYFKNSKAGL